MYTFTYLIYLRYIEKLLLGLWVFVRQYKLQTQLFAGKSVSNANMTDGCYREYMLIDLKACGVFWKLNTFRVEKKMGNDFRFPNLAKLSCKECWNWRMCIKLIRSKNSYDIVRIYSNIYAQYMWGKVVFLRLHYTMSYILQSLI